MKKLIFSLCVMSAAVLLLASGAVAAMSNEEFLKFCGSGTAAEVERAIQDGADVNARGDYNETPLHSAVFNNGPDVVRVLLENGADVNAANEFMVTVLHYAIEWSDNPEVVKTLIENGADVNSVDDDGGTPLRSAVALKNPKFILLLLDGGADIGRAANDLPEETPEGVDEAEWEAIVARLKGVGGAASQEQTPKVEFIVKNSQWQRRSEGKDFGGPIEFIPRHEGGMDISGDELFLNAKVETKGGAVFWLAVQSGNNKHSEHYFGPVGLHFYSEETKKYSFLPIGDGEEDDLYVSSVEFGGDGQFIIDYMSRYEFDDEPSRHISCVALFTFPDLECGFMIEDEAAAKAAWIDDRRFVFYMSEPDLDMASIYLFDTLTGEAPVLKKATKTSTFRTGIHDDGITGQEDEVFVDGSKSAINITEFFVKSEKDLDDFWSNCEFRYLTIDIPALD
jgi:hypothetical protein